MNRRLYFLVNDLAYPPIEDAFVDESGDQVTLLDGAGRDGPLRVSTRWPSSRIQAPDLPASYGANLLLSERAKEVLCVENGNEIELVEVMLRCGSKKAETVRYWWASVQQQAAILDRARARSTKIGALTLKIDRFAVEWTIVPSESIFICRETGTPVFDEVYVERAEAAGLSGKVFVPVEGSRWPFHRAVGD